MSDCEISTLKTTITFRKGTSCEPVGVMQGAVITFVTFLVRFRRRPASGRACVRNDALFLVASDSDVEWNRDNGNISIETLRTTSGEIKIRK
jgi:hypothetical protein